ncbi:MAG: helix-turn-helix transcriptional regulator [Bacteroidaceae bacterium]|nr:helix-turn-helix transcriptional regulator [Bacteroidaceae bacterium]
MTDKEKIELIIQDKHLNSTQFCNEVCIAPGTLSHIRNGRTEPTLNILRSVAQAFPDINPAWLFYGEEPMYKPVTSPTPADDAAVDDTYNNMSSADSADEGQLLFDFSSAQSASRSHGVTVDAPSVSSSAPSSPRRSASPVVASPSLPSSAAPSSVSPRPSSTSQSRPIPAPSAFSVQEVVAETLKQQQRSLRKVVEVRIFFDDGTFETFGAK